MKAEPKVGAEFKRSFVAGKEHVIPFADDKMPAVLATPALIAELEKTAREIVLPLLDDNERTVGTSVEIKHLAPSLQGFTITCLARVLRCDGGEITFQVEASDDVDLLCRGVHRRRVIDVNRVRARVERKRQEHGPM